MDNNRANEMLHNGEYTGMAAANSFLMANLKLEEDLSIQCLNESYFEKKMVLLANLSQKCPFPYWLTHARLAEMVLICAGNYINACEFRHASDLLVNPKQVDLYVKGRSQPILKERHTNISDQLASHIAESDRITWLKKNLTSHIRIKALLPRMVDLFTESGVIAESYIKSLNQRMCDAVDMMTFLMMWQINDITDLYDLIQQCGNTDRTFLESHLYQFDQQKFKEIGHDIYKLLRGEAHSGKILDHSTQARSVQAVND